MVLDVWPVGIPGSTKFYRLLAGYELLLINRPALRQRPFEAFVYANSTAAFSNVGLLYRYVAVVLILLCPAKVLSK